MRAASYIKLSKLDNETFATQTRAIRSFVKEKKWNLILEVKENEDCIESQKERQTLIDAVANGEVDVVIVWKLDRWGKSLTDVMSSIKKVTDAGAGFVSVSEPIDLSFSSDNPLIKMLGLFVEFEHKLKSVVIKDGILESRRKGRNHGRPVTVGKQAVQIKKLFKKGVSKSEIARRLNIGRTSVRRLLEE